MSEKVYVSALPTCDICQHDDGKPGVTAHYDGATVMGPWANMCRAHFYSHGRGLGTGRGQELIVGEAPERTRADIQRDVNAAVEAGDYDALEEAVGDGDIADWL